MNIHAKIYMDETPLSVRRALDDAIATTAGDLINALSSLTACSVAGCQSKARARGYCKRHWQRWRDHGDPTAGRTPNGEPERFIREVAANYEGEDCLIWPYGKSKNGYATVGKVYAHRLVCEIVNGPVPAGKNEAAHSCGSGHLGCVNPRHLRWANRAENMADMVAHGRSGRTVLSADEVRDIIESRGLLKQEEIAAKYGVNRNIITKIQKGKHQAVYAIIDEVANIYGNPDTIMREKAIDAIVEGRAAYWTTSTYSSAITADLPYALNAGVEINRAIEAAFPDHKADCRIPALDTIVPLNRKAALALSVAYSLIGKWRDEHELLARAKRDTRQSVKREPLTYANYLKSKGVA